MQELLTFFFLFYVWDAANCAGFLYLRSKKIALFHVICDRKRPGGGGGVLPYKGLMGTCGQPGYVYRDFCLKQGIEFMIFLS